MRHATQRPWTDSGKQFISLLKTKKKTQGRQRVTPWLEPRSQQAQHFHLSGSHGIPQLYVLQKTCHTATPEHEGARRSNPNSITKRQRSSKNKAITYKITEQNHVSLQLSLNTIIAYPRPITSEFTQKTLIQLIIHLNKSRYE
jgi:hypothetical protein